MPARDGGQGSPFENDDTAHDFEQVLREAARISDSEKQRLSPRLEVGRTLAGGRFQVLRPLSRGGAGAVFVVRDAARSEQLALKLLLSADAVSVYRLKNEFRTLTEIAHPNVVRLYELFAEGDLWFFTMELVDGTPFDEWVRPSGVLDEARLRSATSQLLLGIGAIHDAGKLHRDLKPANVLVTSQGRLVVIDLGLAIDPSDGGVGHTVTEHHISGTPAYMSPEQAAGDRLSEASDYYAIGVMLYEALTGILPFDGSVVSMLSAKQHGPAPSVPPQRSKGLDSLAHLADALLARDPHRRPDRSAIVAVLTECGVAVPPEEPRTRGDGAAALFCGREAELDALRSALAASLRGDCVIMSIVGESGIGKSALCEAFARTAQSEYGAVVLSARCFEHESLPYKALDSLVDAITRHLRKLPESEAAALLPRDAFALARLIPTFARVEVVRRAPARLTNDPEELQQRAFDALAELLARLRDRAPVVVHIDDLQWTDDDSLTCLRQLLVQRKPAPLLMILAQRSPTFDDGASAVNHLLAKAKENPSYRVNHLTLGGLPIAQATQLAMTLVAEHDGALARHCAEEADGNPFVLAQLCLLTSKDSCNPSVTRLVAQRMAPLHGEARLLLEIVALAGRPIAASVAISAAGATFADVELLQAARLLRRAPDARADPLRLISCYHDRIRESVVASIPAHAEQQHWARLAESLAQASDELDHELLCRSLEGAGQHAAAAQHAIQAAAQAASQLAFDRAATLYQRALALKIHVPTDEGALREAQGSALKHAGRSIEAASQFRAAAALATGEHRLDLERRAAEELLAVGQWNAGRKLLITVCEAVGLPPPSRDADPLGMFASHEPILTPQGVRACRAQRPLTSLQRLRLAVAGTTLHSSLRYYSSHVTNAAAQYLTLALEGGDDWHLASALGTCAWLTATSRSNDVWTRRFLDCMDEVVDASEQPDLTWHADVIHGMTLYYQGAFSTARIRFARSEASSRGFEGLQGDLVHFYDQACAFICGDFAHITRFTPAQVEDAHRRGRIWTAAMLSGYSGSVAYLTPDQPGAYERQLQRALACYPAHRGWSWPHVLMLYGEVMLTLYVGEPERGAELLETHRMQLDAGNAGGKLMTALLRGKTAVACLVKHEAAAPSDRRQTWRRRVAESIAAGNPGAYLGIEGSTNAMEAAIALLDGDRGQAIARLRRAARIFADRGIKMYEAAVQRRLGQLCGGREGQALILASELFMQGQQVKNLEAMTELLCPGIRA